MRFVSTRGGGEEEGIEEALRRGYARDGGLYVPKTIRELEEGELERLSRLQFRELCTEILLWFASEELSEEEVRGVVQSCFEGFSSEEIIPLTMLSGRGAPEDGSVLVAELFHGPVLCSVHCVHALFVDWKAFVCSPCPSRTLGSKFYASC